MRKKIYIIHYLQNVVHVYTNLKLVLVRRQNGCLKLTVSYNEYFTLFIMRYLCLDYSNQSIGIRSRY